MSFSVIGSHNSVLLLQKEEGGSELNHYALSTNTVGKVIECPAPWNNCSLSAGGWDGGGQKGNDWNGENSGWNGSGQTGGGWGGRS